MPDIPDKWEDPAFLLECLRIYGEREYRIEHAMRAARRELADLWEATADQHALAGNFTKSAALRKRAAAYREDPVYWRGLPELPEDCPFFEILTCG